MDEEYELDENQYIASVAHDGFITREKRDIPDYAKFKERKHFIELGSKTTLSPEGWTIPKDDQWDVTKLMILSHHFENLSNVLDTLISVRKSMHHMNVGGIGIDRLQQASNLIMETLDHLRLLRYKGIDMLEKKIKEKE